MSKEPALSAAERDRLLAVLDTCDPAATCGVGNDEIGWARDTVKRLSSGTPEATETWVGIAAMVGRSERWCRYMSRTKPDPLPVYRVGGMVRLDAADFRSWLDRARTRGVAERVIQSTPNGPIEV